MNGDTIRDKASILQQVVATMVNRAVCQLDGSDHFHGSPRRIMENLGTSSGTLYHGLKALGILPSGKGTCATWAIPRSVMERFG